ncbi:MAG: hypothetical protein M1830_001674 [Pleopsidium flavum]|nr:MAG: hypothetical protein M1830_001674 [Pleopsidium flavum]
MPSHLIVVKDTSLSHAVGQGNPTTDIEEGEHQGDGPRGSPSSEDEDVPQMIESMMRLKDVGKRAVGRSTWSIQDGSTKHKQMWAGLSKLTKTSGWFSLNDN